MIPELSIIIPAFNRVDLLRYTLQSVREAIQNTSTEILIVDDGSDEPLESQLKEFSSLPIQFLRQKNQGLVLSKNNGLNLAKGEYVLFLDSDDLIHKDKIDLQLEAMRHHRAEVSYSDVAITSLDKPFEDLKTTPLHSYSTETSPERFYFNVQPLPHSPIYRTDYIKEKLSSPIVPASAIFNPIGEVWMYYNLSIFPATIVHVSKPLTILTQHEEERITRHWERQGVASLSLGILFEQHCPRNEQSVRALQLLGENTFSAFRRLPHHFHPIFSEKMLALWRRCPKGHSATLGGRMFQLLALILGPVGAARLLRLYQRPHYREIQTISQEELQILVDSLP